MDVWCCVCGFPIPSINSFDFSFGNFNSKLRNGHMTKSYPFSSNSCVELPSAYSMSIQSVFILLFMECFAMSILDVLNFRVSFLRNIKPLFKQLKLHNLLKISYLAFRVWGREARIRNLYNLASCKTTEEIFQSSLNLFLHVCSSYFLSTQLY